MKAMILAAGLGTRLRPLTESRPKALVEISGRTLLEITLSRLRGLGINDVIVNAHHFADMIVHYLASHRNFGMNVEISREEDLLDTGGGLKQAAHFFLKDQVSREEPFLLHNVDVVSTIDLQRMLQFHIQQKALATLAVQNRKTSRYLLFGKDSELCGRRAGENSPPEMVRSSETAQALAFCGIHVISPRFLGMMSEQGAFSIITSYLRLAALGEKILGFRADEYHWRDVGKPESISQVVEDLKENIIVP